MQLSGDNMLDCSVGDLRVESSCRLLLCVYRKIPCNVQPWHGLNTLAVVSRLIRDGESNISF